jgi:hypothetical protein
VRPETLLIVGNEAHDPSFFGMDATVLGRAFLG